MPKREIKYVPRSTLERLLILYDEKIAHKAYAGILELEEKYKSRIKSENYKLSEKDIILISYGNQIIRPLEDPLKSLNDFVMKHVRDLINTVHILPFYPYSSDDGFSVIDYKDVSPRMGSWDDIEEMAKNFHLMFDGVINHASQYSFWFKGFIRGMKEFEDYFIELDPSTDLSKVVRPRATPVLSEFKDEDGTLHYIWTTFSKDQVDLNYKNYKVLLSVLDALFYYVVKGAKLIRLDAIAFVWKEIGTTCVHLEQTHEIIQLIREIIHEVAPEVIMITETNVPHDENISYFGAGDDEAQMVYNFALPPMVAYSTLSGNTEKLTEWASTLEVPSDKVCFFNFTASHDGVGVRPVSNILDKDELEFLVSKAKEHGGLVSYRALDDGSQAPYEINCNYLDLLTDPEESDEIRVKRFLLSQAVMLAMPGVPGIYFHSLVGSRNHIQGVQTTGMNRSINREKLNYNNLEQELEAMGSLRNIIFQKYRKLLSIRINEPAFNPFGGFDFPRLHESVFATEQISLDCNHHVLALHNFMNETVTLDMPLTFQPPCKDLISGKKYEESTVTLEPYQVAWLKKSKVSLEKGLNNDS